MRLIDADKLEPHEIYEDNGFTEVVYMDDIREMPIVDAEPVRHGRWIEDSNDKWRCSECGIGDMYAYSWDNDVGRKLQDYFCPHCGAKMDLEE